MREQHADRVTSTVAMRGSAEGPAREIGLVLSFRNKAGRRVAILSITPACETALREMLNNREAE